MDLSIIIPCLNEEENLDILVKRTNDSLSKNNIDAEIIRIKPYREHIYKSSKLRKLSE